MPGFKCYDQKVMLNALFAHTPEARHCNNVDKEYKYMQGWN